ncbi:hypothetical protein HPB47_010986, partial [Ixodes persulcatus]
VLESKDMLANGGTIILISDGEENKGPYIAEQLPKLLAKGVIVHTFALGPSAEAKLQDVTLQTGGTAYFFPDYQKNIIASMGISFILSTSSHLEDSQKPVFTETWTVVLERNSKPVKNLSVVVMTKQRGSEDAVRAESCVRHVESTNMIVIYSRVTKGNVRVLKANVTATITLPGKEDPVFLSLHDNGKGADLTADDGEYSAYFTQSQGKGRYSVRTDVTLNPSARMGPARPGKQTPPLGRQRAAESRMEPGENCTSSNTSAECEKEAMGKVVMSSPYFRGQQKDQAPLVDARIKMIAYAGAFQMRKASDPKNLPPDRVRDLAVKDVKRISGNIVATVSWTSTGAHLDAGKGANYDRIPAEWRKSINPGAGRGTTEKRVEADDVEKGRQRAAMPHTSTYWNSCNGPDLREIIRDVVREEIRKLLPAAASPDSPSIAEVVRAKVQQALQPQVLVSAATEPPTLSYAAATRRPPPPAHPYTAPPRREPPAPQFSRRQEDRAHAHPEPAAPRKTDVWRTADRRPLCYHCGEAGHIYRRCPYRQLGLRGFHPNDPRPRYDERPRDIEEYLRRPPSPVSSLRR